MLNTLPDQQSLQQESKTGSRRTTWCEATNPGQRVLHALQSIEVVVGDTVEDYMTVVKSREVDQACNCIDYICHVAVDELRLLYLSPLTRYSHIKKNAPTVIENDGQAFGAPFD